MYRRSLDECSNVLVGVVLKKVFRWVHGRRDGDISMSMTAVITISGNSRRQG